MWEAVILTVATLAGNNVGKVLQKEGTESLPQLCLHRKVMQKYRSSRTWIIGEAVDMCGALLMLKAVSQAPMRNPHYICGARVLVKPYREKGKHGDSKYSERADHARFVQKRSIDSKDLEFHTGTKFYDDDEAFRRMEEDEQVLERCLAELHLVDAQRRCVEADATMAVMATQNRALQNNGFSSDDLGLFDEGLSQFHPSNSFGYLLDVLDGAEQTEEIEPALNILATSRQAVAMGIIYQIVRSQAHWE